MTAHCPAFADGVTELYKVEVTLLDAVPSLLFSVSLLKGIPVSQLIQI